MRRESIIAVLMAAALCAGAAQKAPELRYNRDIRPILSDNCFRCHGADKGSRKAKLRLDDRQSAIDKGAFVPGKPDESELVRRIFTTNEDDVMPPADSHKQLTPAQKEKLKRWVADGAEYEPHWSFITPKRPAPPKTSKTSNRTLNTIDAFVFAQLEANNVSPSAEADRRTLLRRLSLDLIGLPPTPFELSVFENDKSATAYAKQVERLLASPHYGERMAVPWLDVVRYADTVGYHGDQNVNVFPYREYVIDAFNKNKPFDRFTLEQLAGDLMPATTVEQRVATGFNRLNMITREGGAQPKEYLAKYGADRVRTVGMAWMGLTVGCAECHDHKYDPFTTKDFYQLKAFFADVRQWGVYSDYKYTPNPDLKGWDNDHPFPPEEVVPSVYLQRRMEWLSREIGDLALAAAGRHGEEFSKWTNSLAAILELTPDGFTSPEPVVMVVTNTTVVTNVTKQTNIVASTPTSPAITNISRATTITTNLAIMNNFVVLEDRTVLFGRKPEAHPIPVKLRNETIAAVRLELRPHEIHGGSVFRIKAGTTLQLSGTVRHAGSTNETRIAFYFADADVKDARYSNGAEVLGIRDGWKITREQGNQKLIGTWILDPPLKAEDGDLLMLSLKTNPVGALRVSVSPFAAVHPFTNGSAMAQQSQAALATAWLASTAADTNAFARYKTLHRELLECRGGKSPTVVTVPWTPEVTRVLPRGNWLSDDGELVDPLPPHFLPQATRDDTNRLTRLDLAKWLNSAENPLTARTVVNRLWKQFFGTGLANPVDDLGVQGEPPTHPELLDWLAVEFRESGWDVKHIVRLIVTSSTYRQTSNASREARDRDPGNKLLAVQNARRLEAEFVRDNALAISGLLNREIGGPSSFPYQPADYYTNLQFPDRDYHPSKDERQYRRGLYSHWQRTFLQPMLANFDAPSREECAAIRTVSNTPQQALTLLNDPTFVEAARAWAAALLRAKVDSDDERLALAFNMALGRAIKESERESLKRFLARQREHLQEHKDEPTRIQKVGYAPPASGVPETELGAWISVCRVILNLHETITIY